MNELHDKGNLITASQNNYEGLMKSRYLLLSGIALILFLGACSSKTSTPTSDPDEFTEPTAVPTEARVMDEDAIYLNLVWQSAPTSLLQR